MAPPIYLVVGPPGAGKSATARALAAALDPGVHLAVDDLRHSVVGGLATPAPVWTEEIARQVGLARVAALRVADVYASAGFAVVIDDFYDPLDLREYRDLARRPGVHRIVLLPAEAEARRRSAARDGGAADPGMDRAIGHGYGIVGRVVDRLRGEGWRVLDSTRLDVAATVRAILSPAAGVGDAGGVGVAEAGEAGAAGIGDAGAADAARGQPSKPGGSSSNSR